MAQHYEPSTLKLPGDSGGRVYTICLRTRRRSKLSGSRELFIFPAFTPRAPRSQPPAACLAWCVGLTACPLSCRVGLGALQQGLQDADIRTKQKSPALASLELAFTYFLLVTQESKLCLRLWSALVWGSWNVSPACPGWGAELIQTPTRKADSW